MINLQCPKCGEHFSDDDCVFNGDQTQCSHCNGWSILHHNDDDNNLNHGSRMWLAEIAGRKKQLKTVPIIPIETERCSDCAYYSIIEQVPCCTHQRSLRKYVYFSEPACDYWRQKPATEKNGE